MPSSVKTAPAELATEERRRRLTAIFEGVGEAEMPQLLEHLRLDLEAVQAKHTVIRGLREERERYARDGNQAGVQACDRQIAHYERDDAVV